MQPEHRPKADTNAPDAALPAQLPVRSPQGHKGTFGTVLVVGGCSAGTRRMIGAPALAAMAALRAGAGLARLLVPTPILDAAIAIAPSATGHALAVDADGAIIPHLAAEAFDTHSSDANCLVVGPGLGDGPGPTALALRAVQHADVPVVVDADALNCLADLPDLTPDVRAAAILTPHPGEYRRLADALRIKHDPTNETSRTAAAEALAQRLGVIVALKGARTVVSDGQRTWTCRHQCPALATAGTGDVLAGLIAGLVAQFVPPLAYLRLPRRPADRPLDPWQATCLAVEAHALAGQRWADRSKATGGMLASELADQLPPILESLRKSPGP
ncbi:MAG: NAD(P)H-hydrate dehydratase [Phycisphaerales bacterium]